jgi:hypothetical protein
VTELSLLAVYKPADGIEAETAAGTLQLTWPGERDQRQGAQFAIREGQSLVQELAACIGPARKSPGFCSSH